MHSRRLAVALALSSGCLAPEQTALGEFLALEHEAQCAFRVRCGISKSERACDDEVQTAQHTLQSVGSAAFGRATYDSEAAHRYLNNLKERPCDRTDATSDALTHDYDDVFAGELDLGESCLADEECGVDAACDRHECPDWIPCCLGTCVAVKIVEVGASCTTPAGSYPMVARCPEGATCAPPEDNNNGGNQDEPPSPGTCVLRVDNGAPCNRDNDCLDGQRCDTASSGTCYKLAASGEPCNPNLQTGACLNFDEVCDQKSKTCVRRPGDGDACPQRFCLEFATCNEENAQCERLPGRDDACDGVCAGSLRCQDGTCQPTLPRAACVEGVPPPTPME